MVLSQQQSTGRQIHRRGVTLVELLITISIIMVLASLLVPMIGWVRQSTQQGQCQNNLRQLGAAVWIYAQLNGDRIPASRNFGSLKPTQSFAWFHRLPPLMSSRTVAQGGGTFFQCPLFNGEGAGLLSNEVPKSYKMNSKIDQERNRYIPFRFNLISDPRDVVLFVDAITTGGMGQWGHAPSSAVDDKRHRGWVGVLYADGHTTRVQSRPSAGWKDAFQWESVDWK